MTAQMETITLAPFFKLGLPTNQTTFIFNLA